MSLSYFSKLPIIDYSLNKDKTKKARDILHRLFFDEKFLNQSEYIRKYEVLSGDRPEIISDKLYGRSDLYTVIMLLNAFDTSMLSGLPPMSSIYDEYLEEKYSEDVYYLIPINVNLSPLGNGLSGGYVFPLLQRSFAPGEIIYAAGADGFQDYTTRAYVKEWNPVLSSLKLDILSGVFSDGMTLANYNGSVNFKISHKKRGRDALHHFEATKATTSGGNRLVKGMILDPLSRLTISGDASYITPIGMYKDGITGSYASSIIYAYNLNGGKLTTTLQAVAKVITNQEQEERNQEKKRKINVPARDPMSLGDIITKVNEILESTSG